MLPLQDSTVAQLHFNGPPNVMLVLTAHMRLPHKQDQLVQEEDTVLCRLLMVISSHACQVLSTPTQILALMIVSHAQKDSTAHTRDRSLQLCFCMLDITATMSRATRLQIHTNAHRDSIAQRDLQT